MSDIFKPRRSLLYMPASNARVLEKAKTLPADGIILDLEDGVAPDDKVIARKQACEAASAKLYGARELIIRVNAKGSAWVEDDLDEVIAAGPDGILLPKVNTAGDVEKIAKRLNKQDGAEHVQIWAMIETPLGVLNAQSIAALANDPANRLQAWIIGTNDLAKDIGCKLDPMAPPLVDVLSHSIIAARAYGLVIIDGVYNDIADLDGFAKACVTARDMGFDGKTLIHPNQVDPCNEIFAPPADEIERAQKIIEAFDLPENKGKGVIVLEGRMVERLHLQMAQRTMAIAETIAGIDKG